MNKEQIIEKMAKEICTGCRERHKCENNVCAMSEIVAKHLYNAGYRKETQGEWISVEDRLPQENEKVLAINSEGEIFIATYLVHKVSPSARGYKTWASGLWNGTPTHWQPLPQPPKMRGE